MLDHKVSSVLRFEDLYSNTKYFNLVLIITQVGNYYIVYSALQFRSKMIENKAYRYVTKVLTNKTS